MNDLVLPKTVEYEIVGMMRRCDNYGYEIWHSIQ